MKMFWHVCFKREKKSTIFVQMLFPLRGDIFVQMLFPLLGERLSNLIDLRGNFPQCWVGKKCRGGKFEHLPGCSGRVQSTYRSATSHKV